MHVLHVIDGLGLGGAERMLVDIVNRTVADGHRASVCVTRSNVTLAYELDPRVAILVLKRKHKFSARALVRFARWVRAHQVDVIHAHLRSTLSFVLLARVCRLVRTPIVFHDHYGTIETDTSTPGWFRLGLPYISHYVGVYDRLCEWAQRAGIPAERTTTISNTLDLRRLTNAPAGAIRMEVGIAGFPLGVLVATVRRDKGIETLLEAVALSAHRERIVIAVIGASPERDYAEKCEQLRRQFGIERSIVFLGPRTDVPSLLKSVDFAVLSSHTESGPLVLIEYLAARLPIVSTRVGDIGHRLAAVGVPGFVPPGDPAAFARELDVLLALSQDERTARGELGWRALTAEWDLQATISRWYDVYRKASVRP